MSLSTIEQIAQLTHNMGTAGNIPISQSLRGYPEKQKDLEHTSSSINTEHLATIDAIINVAKVSFEEAITKAMLYTGTNIGISHIELTSPQPIYHSPWLKSQFESKANADTEISNTIVDL